MSGRLKLGTTVIAVTALTALFTAELVPMSSNALADAEVEVEVEVEVDPVEIDPEYEGTTVEIVGEAFPGSITIDGHGKISDAELDTSLQAMCVQRDSSVISTTNYCVGETMPVGFDSFDLDALWEPVIASDSEASAAIGWIVQEGVQYVRAVYDVPMDFRIERYARAEIRSYVQNRLLDIIDKAVYDVPLTEPEQLALSFTQDRVMQTDRALAQYAVDEYARWKAGQCGYQVPTAPTFVTDPVGMPRSVRHWCLRAGLFARLFDFAPPVPSAGHFTTWAMYRHSDELGLRLPGTDIGAGLLAANARAGLALSGFALAGGAAGLALGTVGSSAALSATFTGVMGSYAASGIAANAWGPALTSSIMSQVGAASAASVIGIVVSAAVILAVGIWKLIESGETSRALSQALSVANKTNDPFRITKLRETYGGRELRDGITADNMPDYRSQRSTGRLLNLVTTWTTTTKTGLVLADPSDIWDNNTTSPRDYRFEITDSSGTRTVEQIEVPIQDGGVQSVRFSGSWLVLTGSDGQAHPALSFDYLDANGDPALAARMRTDFSITTASEADGVQVLDSPSISYLDANGNTVMAAILAPEYVPAAGPHPTAVGPLHPERVVNLRPNPTDVNGAFNLEAFTTDFSYHWAVSRYDSVTGTWSPVLTHDDYGASFVPDQPGQYRASVVMTDLVEPDAPTLAGVVNFEVTAPPIEVQQMVLHDDGAGALQLDLSLTEAVPQDTIEVTVQWPGSFADAATEATAGASADSGPTPAVVELGCHPDALHCATGDTAENPMLREALSFQMSQTADTRAGVTVMLRNSYGSVSTHRLAIEGPQRLTFTDPPGGAVDTDLASIDFDDQVTHVQVAAGIPTGYGVAGIVPGETTIEQTDFGLVDPATGNVTTGFAVPGLARTTVSVAPNPDGIWVLQLDGTPAQHEIGSVTVPVTVQQNTGARSTLLMRIDVVPALGDRYRGGLIHDIDPAAMATSALPFLQPMIIGGKAEWEDYAGEVCVSITAVTPGHGGGEACEPAETIVANIEEEKPFPYRQFFPDGLAPDTYRMSVWLAADEHSSAEPMKVSFILESGPPTITELAWDKTTGQIRLQVDPFSADAAIASIACTLDGIEVPSCFDSGDAAPWAPDQLTVGRHSMSVQVTDNFGNFTGRDLEFEVPKPTDDSDDGTGGDDDSGGVDGTGGDDDAGTGGGDDADTGDHAGTGDDDPHRSSSDGGSADGGSADTGNADDRGADDGTDGGHPGQSVTDSPGPTGDPGRSTEPAGSGVPGAGNPTPSGSAGQALASTGINSHALLATLCIALLALLLGVVLLRVRRRDEPRDGDLRQN